MKFTKVENLKYSSKDNSTIDLLATCEEFGTIPMTLNIVDTEDLHLYVDSLGVETPLEEYCKSLKIQAYSKPTISEESRIYLIKAKANEVIESIYPTFKQLNIIRLGGDDLIEMGIFIDSIRTISNEAESNGTALEDINWTV